jgi:hypothetical protein
MRTMPAGFRSIAADALVQPPFTLPFRRGDMTLHVGWAILPPSPAFADLPEFNLVCHAPRMRGIQYSTNMPSASFHFAYDMLTGSPACAGDDRVG